MTAAETVATEAAKAEFLQKQQAEAATQRRKDHERRRSLSSNNILASPRSGTDEFGQLGGGGGGRPKSIASLSGLLSLKRNSSSGDLLVEPTPAPPQELESPRRRESYVARDRSDRRQSAQSFASTSKRLSQISLASPPHNIRRHSLTTLLETSFDDANPDVVPSPPRGGRPGMNDRSDSTGGGLAKVTEWRRSGTLASLRPPSIQSQSQRPTPPAPVEPATPTKKGGSKKNSWLDY